MAPGPEARERVHDQEATASSVNPWAPGAWGKTGDSVFPVGISDSYCYRELTVRSMDEPHERRSEGRSESSRLECEKGSL